MQQQLPGRDLHGVGIGKWLCSGWHDFLLTRWISMGFSSVFVVIAMLAYWLLLEQDLGLVLYPFIAGFMVISPLLVTGFQRVGRLLKEGRQVRSVFQL